MNLRPELLDFPEFACDCLECRVDCEGTNSRLLDRLGALHITLESFEALDDIPFDQAVFQRKRLRSFFRATGELVFLLESHPMSLDKWQMAVNIKVSGDHFGFSKQRRGRDEQG